jgi:hypothetical protein
MAYPPHRNQNSYFPNGWADLKTKFPDEFCAFTGPHGSAAKTLCTNGGSHAWYNIPQKRDVMCVKAPPYVPDKPFEGNLAARRGADAGTYKFQRVRASDAAAASAQNYVTVMIEACAKIQMKPLCDHPSYCGGDSRSVYIGQDHHIAHGGHRNSDAYFPSGWSQLKGKFPNNFCTFTGSSGGDTRTLCTYGNSHQWQYTNQNREIMCAKAPPYEPPAPFSGDLEEMNGINKGTYTFRQVRISSSSGNFDTIMINECSKIDMKPLCDHPSYCKSDPRATYIGQNYHIAYPPHRNQISYFPQGWADLKSKFPAEICTFTGNSGGAHQTLCTNGGSHAWYSADKKKDIMCAKAPAYKPDPPFKGELGSKNGANAGEYVFQKIRASVSSGNMDTIMVNECAKKDMKPLCDHPSYCKNDPRAGYIGQSYHIAYPPHRNQDSYFPSGWSALKGKFPANLCAFTGPHGGAQQTLCTSGGSHAWRTISNGGQDIMCVKTPPFKPDPPFSGVLGSRNGAPGGAYTFQKTRAAVQSGNFDTIMVNECNKIGMKPLCDHPSYCKNDPKSTYIGQTHHIAYYPHRNVGGYFPSGWDNLKGKFTNDFCTYTAQHGGSHQSLCTNGGSHSWYQASSRPDIMCVKAPDR